MFARRSVLRPSSILEPILVLVLLGGLAACGGAASRFASYMERGQQYSSRGDLSKASVEFRNALQIRPTSAQAWFMNAQVEERRGNLQAALGQYQHAIDLEPDYAAPRAGLGRLLVLANAANRALDVIRPALEKHPDDADLLSVRAAARTRLKDYAGALADAKRAVQLAPTNEVAVSLLAAMYRNDGDPERATQVVSDALKRLPDSADLRIVLADLYLETKQPREAEEQLRTVVQLRPQDLRSRYQLAFFYARSGRPDQAQDVLTQAVKARPDSNEPKLVLVEFLSQQRSPKAGVARLRAFIAADPGNYELQLGLGALLEHTGSADDAVKVYEAIIARDGHGRNGLIARDEIAGIEAGRGHDDAARKLIQEVLSDNPRDTAALIVRADLAIRHNDPAAAITDLRGVLRDAPQAVPVRRALARAFLANGEPALAEEALRAALETSPADPEVRIQLAQVLLHEDRPSEAAPLLEETVRRAPANLQAREQLVRAYMAKRDWAAARVAVDDLKTLQPNMAIGFYLSGLIAQAQNELPSAQEELQHALDLQPSAMDALTALAKVQVATGQGAAAVARVEQVVAREPRNAPALDLLGELQTARNEPARAIQTLSRAIQAAPDWWYPYRNLAVAYIVAKDPKRAILAYQDGIHAAADPQPLVVELASFYERDGRVDDAISLYDDLYRRNPRSASVASALGMLLVTYRKDQRSLDRARDVTQAFANSEDGMLLDSNGWVRFKRGEYAEALAVLQRAAQRAPGTSIIRYHLGMAEIKRGELVRARQDLESALAGSVRFAGAEEARMALESLNGRKG